MLDKLVSVFGRATVVETGFSVAAYSTCSISMVILNKLVIGTHEINFPAALVFFQALFSWLLVDALKRLGYVEFPAMDRPLLMKWLPLTGLFVGMLATSMLGLRTMSVSITVLIKNLALVFIAIGDNYFFGHYLDKWTLLSFAMMVLGSYIGAQQDSNVTAWGLFWNFANVGCTTGYQLYMKMVLNEEKKRLGRWGPVYYNNFLTMPPLLLPTLASSSDWSAAVGKSNEYAKLWLLLMMFCGAVMTMASFWCMRMTSPTTYSVVGALNKVPLAIISMYVFDQYPTLFGAYGIVLALGGGVLYTIVNMQASTAKAMQENREKREAAERADIEEDPYAHLQKK